MLARTHTLNTLKNSISESISLYDAKFKKKRRRRKRKHLKKEKQEEREGSGA